MRPPDARTLGLRNVFQPHSLDTRISTNAMISVLSIGARASARSVSFPVNLGWYQMAWGISASWGDGLTSSRSWTDGWGMADSWVGRSIWSNSW